MIITTFNLLAFYSSTHYFIHTGTQTLLWSTLTDCMNWRTAFSFTAINCNFLPGLHTLYLIYSLVISEHDGPVIQSAVSKNSNILVMCRRAPTFIWHSQFWLVRFHAIDCYFQWCKERSIKCAELPALIMSFEGICRSGSTSPRTEPCICIHKK